MRGRRIKDNPESSEIEVGMEVKIDAFQASASVGDEWIASYYDFFCWH